MMRLHILNYKLLGLIMLFVMLSACNTNESEVMELPTRYQSSTPIPSLTATHTPQLVVMLESPTVTASSTPTATQTPTPVISDTPLASKTPSKDATIRQTTYLYNAPHQQWLGQIEGGKALFLSGRSNDGLWYEVETEDGQAGWLPSEYVHIADGAKAVPITYEIVYTATPTPLPILIPSSTPPANPVMRHAQQIYQQGLATGNRPNVFSKVGDSITAGQAFFKGYDHGQYNLGNYGHLQETITFFSGSFGRDGVADFDGNGVDLVFDPMRAFDPGCQPNESPLDCEYRVYRPSVSIIMLGSVDVQRNYTPEEFGQKMRQVIDTTLRHNVIPVLTSFPNAHDYYPDAAQLYNMELYRLSEEYVIPMIDLRSALGSHPGGGVRGDGFHLSDRGGDGDWYIDLGGEQFQYGLTLRNLMTLEMLDQLMREIPLR